MPPKNSSVETISDKIANKCIAIVDRERTNWEEAVIFVTPQVGFRMRELIRLLRKNYWGVFDQPFDSQTGREKIWIGLAMSTVETWVKNIDLDTKDVGFVARNPNGYNITELTRLVVKDYLDRIYFGETLDKDERQLCIDGTLVWKTWQEGPDSNPVMKRRTVDLLNVYIDPTEEDIQSAYRFTERGLMLPDQLEGMTGWKNTKNLTGSRVLNKIDGNHRSNQGQPTTGEFRDVWETWGKIPKWVVTGDDKASDANEEIDGHIVVSGFEAGGPKFHFVEENKKKDHFGNPLKPYEEVRTAKISGRWYGLGPLERIIALQEYLNTIVNIRINRGYVSQLGLFKIKKGKGITAQMLSRLPVNGAIQVSDMDDIQQMAIAEAGVTSYKDEEVIKYWAQQMSSAFPISTGEIMPSSASATASSIAASSAKSAYSMFKEAMGTFLERWLDRHALPIIAKTVHMDDIVRLSSDDDKFKSLIETIAINSTEKALRASKHIPSPEELLMVLAMEEERLRKSGQIFISMIQKIIASGLYTKVHITNEDLDTAVTIQNLLQMMQLEMNDPAAMLETKKQVYDLMGLQMPKPKLQAQFAQPGMGAPGAAPMPQMPQPSLMGQTQAANAPGPGSNR